MASRSIAIRITVDNREAINAAKAQEIAMRSLNDTTDKQTHLQDGLTASFLKGNLAARGISVAYIAVRDSLQAMIREGVQFEFTLAKITAISGESQTAVKGLEKDIRALALSSNRSANEIAKASLEMNKIGLSNPQVRLLLGSVVALSTALDEDLVKSGETVVNILNAYGDSVLLGKKRTEELAYTVGASALSMESFSTAFAYVGATAKLAGVKFEDLTAAMDVLSNAGVRSSTIGTQLRRIIADLSDENSKASKAIGGTIESLGGFIPAIDKLRQATPKGDAGVSFLTEIFGRTATSVAALLATNVDELRRFSSETENATGNLDRMQSIMNGTVSGALTQLKNQFLDIGISITEVFAPAVKFGIASAIEQLDHFIQANKAIVFTVKEINQAILSSGAPKPGIGNLRVLDEAQLKEQSKAADALKKTQNELEGQAREAHTADTLERIKTAFDAYKTFGDKFDFKDATRQLTELSKALRAVGDDKEAIKVMRELRAIQGEEKKQEFSPVFRSAVRKEFQDSDFTKDVNKALSPKRVEKNKEEIQKLQDSAQKFVIEQNKNGFGETDRKSKLAIFDIEQKEKLAVFKKYQIDTTDFEKAQAKERTEYSARLYQAELQMKLALAGQYAGAATAATAALAKNYKSLHVLAKTAAIAEIAINTAVAVSKVWGQTGIYGFLAQAAPIAMGITQAAIVSQQKFASGTDRVFREPTLIQVGEAGAERVRVTPRAKLSEDSGSGGGNTFIIHGDVHDYDTFQRKVKQAQDSNRKAFV